MTRRAKGEGSIYWDGRSTKFTLPDRFWAKVDKSGECWIWLASKRNGYGQFGVRKGYIEYAHRWAYMALVGPLPEGKQLDHLCRNTTCVRPGHLELVEPAENYRRGMGFSGRNHRKRACPQGHQYDEVNTYVDRGGSRHCRTCRRERMQRHRDARKAAV